MRAMMLTGVVLVAFLFGPLQCLAGERMPLRVQLLLTKVYPLMEQEKYDQAVQILNEFRTRVGQGGADVHEHPSVNITLGNCYHLQGRFEDAAATYRRVIEREPDNRDGWQNLARSVYELGQHEEASRCFLQAYQLGEQADAQLLYYGALTMLMAEKYHRAIALFQQLFTHHSQQIQSPWKENLVYAYLAAEQNKQALPSIRELVDEYEGKKKRQWREILLQQYLVLGMYNQAKRFGIELTRVEPGEPLWWKSLAHVYLQQNQLEPALQALTIYSYLAPLALEERKLIADLHLQLGVPIKAVGDYEAFLNAEPDVEILKRLVHAYMELGHAEAALKRLEQFDPKEKRGDLCMLKGEILYGLKRYRDAEAAFTRTVKQKEKPRTGRAFLMLAYCHWQMQDMKKSIDAFRKAEDYKRYKREAEQAIIQLEKIRLQQKSLAAQ